MDNRYAEQVPLICWWHNLVLIVNLRFSPKLNA